jgi:hypothetical protein
MGGPTPVLHLPALIGCHSLEPLPLLRRHSPQPLSLFGGQLLPALAKLITTVRG